MSFRSKLPRISLLRVLGWPFFEYWLPAGFTDMLRKCLIISYIGTEGWKRETTHPIQNQLR